MKSKLKELMWVMVTILITFISCYINNPVYADMNVKVMIDGNYIQFEDAAPTIIEGRTLIPVRKVSESLNANVGWDAETRTVTISKDEKSFSLTIDSKVVDIANANDVVLDVPAQIINDRAYVPVRFVSESFGYVVGWDGSTQTVSIVTEGGDFTLDEQKEVKTTGIYVYDSKPGEFVIADTVYFDHYELYYYDGGKILTDHTINNVDKASYRYSLQNDNYHLMQITDISEPILNEIRNDVKNLIPNNYESIVEEVVKVYNNGKTFNIGEIGQNYESVIDGWNVTIKKWPLSLNLDIYR